MNGPNSANPSPSIKAGNFTVAGTAEDARLARKEATFASRTSDGRFGSIVLVLDQEDCANS